MATATPLPPPPVPVVPVPVDETSLIPKKLVRARPLFDPEILRLLPVSAHNTRRRP